MSSSTWRVLNGYAKYQRTPVRMISCGKWAPLKLTGIVSLPLVAPRSPREIIPQIASNKNCDRTSVVGVGVSRRDEIPLRALGPNHGHRASGVRAEVVGCQAEKCLLLPGDDIS